LLTSKLPRACRASIQTVDPNDLAAGAPARQQIDERLGQLIEAVPVLLDDAKSTLPDPLPELLKRLVPVLLRIFEDGPRVLHGTRKSCPRTDRPP